jgi:hypothetical protein
VPDIPGAGVEPPTPPAWTLTEADWNALVASNKAAIQRIAVLEDRLKAVAAALQ